MKWFRHCALSKEDMEWLSGSSMMEHLQKNRLVIKFYPNEKQPEFSEIGLYDLENPFYMKSINENVIELYFSSREDLIAVEEKFAQIKLMQD